MTGETNLDLLISKMEPVLRPGIFVFATFARGTMPDGLDPIMVFEEAEGTTAIMDQAVALERQIDAVFPSRMITLNIHSSLDAVGFMARIATALASEGIGVNPVAGYYHDHLFVPQERADDAVAALRKLIKT
ncbi:MAG: ACT domain-containing protein [Pseudomonadota bacterium]